MSKRISAKVASRRVYDEVIKPFRALASQYGRGFEAKIVRQMESQTGARFHRQHVALWLHRDPKKRVEPRLGAGMLLLNAMNSMERQSHENLNTTNTGEGGGNNRV